MTVIGRYSLAACLAACSLGSLGSATAQDLLADVGPLSAMPGAHETGSDLIWAVPAGAAAGVSASREAGHRLAQPFVLDRAATIDAVEVFAYQQGAVGGASIDFVGVELWDGPPDQAGSARIAGDASQGTGAAVGFAGAYAALHGVTHTADRAVYALRAGGLSWRVPAGEYWLVWSVGGTLDGGPYSPYLGDDTAPVAGRALQRVLGVWQDAQNAADGGQRVALPLRVFGEVSCVADCDGDGRATIFDFLCFQNAFAAGEERADCDGNGRVEPADFLCFSDAFDAGCP